MTTRSKRRLPGLPWMKGQAVLRVEMQRQIWHNAQHRDPGEILQHVQARTQQGGIPAEPVDDRPFYQGAFRFVKQGQGTRQRSKYPAAIDIPDQQDRGFLPSAPCPC